MAERTIRRKHLIPFLAYSSLDKAAKEQRKITNWDSRLLFYTLEVTRSFDCET
jgi:hypothetical protein